MTSFQLVIDCADPGALVAFWSDALGYVPEPAPDGFGTWNAYWLSRGLPEAELDTERDSCDSIVDPAGAGPRIWFQVVPEGKAAKNRLHLDIRAGGGPGVPVGVRKERIEAEAARLVGTGASRLRTHQGVVGHYAVLMADPEGNEFCLH
jgi:Glyoxalase-like domain